MPRRLPIIDLRPGTTQFYVAALFALFVANALAIWVAFADSVPRATLNGILAVVPIVVMAPAVRIFVLRILFPLRLALQLATHIAAASLFAVLLYWLTEILIGVSVTHNPVKVSVPDFFAPAAAWMILQGLTLYALIVLAAYIEVLRAELTVVSQAGPAVSADANE